MPRRIKDSDKKEAHSARKGRGRPKKKLATKEIQLEINHEKVDYSAGNIVLRKFSQEELEIQRQKTKLMWVGVWFVMVVVAILWMTGLRSSFFREVRRNTDKQGNFSDFKGNLQAQMDQINKNFEVIKTGVKTGLASTSIVATGTLPIASSSDYNTNISELNGQLEQILNQATSTVNN